MALHFSLKKIYMKGSICPSRIPSIWATHIPFRKLLISFYFGGFILPVLLPFSFQLDPVQQSTECSAPSRICMAYFELASRVVCKGSLLLQVIIQNVKHFMLQESTWKYFIDHSIPASVILCIY